MTSVFSATPPAGQPPASTDGQPAAWGFAGRWDWLRIGIFFWGAVFLLGLITTTLHDWYYTMLTNFHSLYASQVQVGTAFSISGLMLPAILLIAGSALSDRTFWGITGRERRWAIGRLALALVVVAAITGIAFVFGDRIYHALQPSPVTLNDIRTQPGVWGAIWLVSGVERGLVSAVALPFVFRRLSPRTGRAWLTGLLSAALFAGGIFGFYGTLGTVTQWAINAWMQFVRDPQHMISCAGGSGVGCFAPQAQTWLLAGILPSVLILPLGALIGVPLTHPYGVRESRATEAMGVEGGLTAQLQPAPHGRRFWRALGIGACSFAAGLFVIGTRLYAISQVPSMTGSTAQILLVAVQLAPFGVLALIGGIRLVRLPREQRPSVRNVRMLALVAVLGLLPTLVPLPFLMLDSVSFACVVSLGALLALCWWPATASSMRRTLAVTTLAGWLGVALPILLVAGSAAYQLATHSSGQSGCHALGCMGAGVVAFGVLSQIIEIGVTSIILGLPLILFGVWMGSWLLQRGDLSRARGG